MGGTSEQGRSFQGPLSGARLQAGMRGKLLDVVKRLIEQFICY